MHCKAHCIFGLGKMDELIATTDIYAIKILLVVNVGLCAYILMQNKIIKDLHGDYKTLIENSTAALTEMTVLIKGFLLK